MGSQRSQTLCPSALFPIPGEGKGWGVIPSRVLIQDLWCIYYSSWLGSQGPRFLGCLECKGSVLVSPEISTLSPSGWPWSFNFLNWPLGKPLGWVDGREKICSFIPGFSFFFPVQISISPLYLSKKSRCFRKRWCRVDAVVGREHQEHQETQTLYLWNQSHQQVWKLAILFV